MKPLRLPSTSKTVQMLFFVPLNFRNRGSKVPEPGSSKQGVMHEKRTPSLKDKFPSNPSKTHDQIVQDAIWKKQKPDRIHSSECLSSRKMQSLHRHALRQIPPSLNAGKKNKNAHQREVRVRMHRELVCFMQPERQRMQWRHDAVVQGRHRE